MDKTDNYEGRDKPIHYSRELDRFCYEDGAAVSDVVERILRDALQSL